MTEPKRTGRELREQIAHLNERIEAGRYSLSSDGFLALVKHRRELQLQLRDLERAEWGD